MYQHSHLTPQGRSVLKTNRRPRHTRVGCSVMVAMGLYTGTKGRLVAIDGKTSQIWFVTNENHFTTGKRVVSDLFHLIRFRLSGVDVLSPSLTKQSMRLAYRTSVYLFSCYFLESMGHACGILELSPGKSINIHIPTPLKERYRKGWPGLVRWNPYLVQHW